MKSITYTVTVTGPDDADFEATHSQFMTVVEEYIDDTKTEFPEVAVLFKFEESHA